ncbi:hypothetical protein NDU88_001314 [Pleurodeles waltl]|uniref:Uncharacterized protein n=1 Tax=Pleurodeles waltl TaxID=8319 RepID=A0AAV7THY4_PLEWA|nr:hypothetical protein NDU88_001314 [Pleurodeles waltl]
MLARGPLVPRWLRISSLRAPRVRCPRCVSHVHSGIGGGVSSAPTLLGAASSTHLQTEKRKVVRMRADERRSADSLAPVSPSPPPLDKQQTRLIGAAQGPP